MSQLPQTRHEEDRSQRTTRPKSESPISVTFFRVSYDTMGGGSQMLLRLLRGLDGERFDVTLVSQRADELCERAAAHGVDVRIVPFPPALDRYDGRLLELPAHEYLRVGLRTLQYNVDLWRELETPDVLWCGGTRPFASILPYAFLTDAETIFNVGLLNESAGSMRYINDVILRATDHVFIESTEQARRQLTEGQFRAYGDKFTVFHKGIHVERFDPGRFDDGGDESPLRVGTAALISPRKGLEYFVDAAATVLENRPDVEFTIAGDLARATGERYRAALDRRIRAHGIEDRVTFLGWVEDMPAYLNTLDVFVLPSHNEGIPGSVREALAMEVPAVATDVGGTPEVVVDGETGYLVEPADATAIADRVDRLLDDRSLRCELGRRGRAHVRSAFSIDSYVEQYERFLERIA